MAFTWCLWTVAGPCLAAPASPAPPPHILITATEALYRRKMPEAFELVLKLGLEAKDLTDADRVQLQILTAMRWVDAGDEDAAKKAIDLGSQLQLTQEERAQVLLRKGGGGALVTGAVVVMASGPTQANQVGQAVGAILAIVGATSMVGGILLQAQPELLGMRVNVAPTYQGGLVLATGRF
jgi:hypothetical protein